MQVPKRKPGKFTHLKADPHITEAKFNELENTLKRLKHSQPAAIEEVKRLALMGDFSENAAYQIAKGRLRGINQRILDIEDHLRRAIIIKPNSKTNYVQIGSIVSIEIDGKKKTYQILGPSETDPSRNIISHLSPLGSALIGKKIDVEFQIILAEEKRKCRILAIE